MVASELKQSNRIGSPALLCLVTSDGAAGQAALGAMNEEEQQGQAQAGVPAP
jgi:hypothetical protein